MSTAYHRLTERIREQILSGELQPGDRLPTEQEISAHYQVSRNTAREAMRTLASQGLLTIKRGVTGGAFVALPNPEQVSDSLQLSLALLTKGMHLSVSELVEVRELLEVPATELAALRRTDDELAEIRDSLFDPRTVEPASVFSNTWDFHARVLRAAHNPLLELVAQPVHRVLNERFLRERMSVRMLRQVDRDHREIIGYLTDRDQAGAREAARAHLRTTRTMYERIDRDA